MEEENFSLITRRNYIRDLHMLFAFALSRNWTAMNPVKAIAKPSEIEGEPTILSAEELRKLLCVAENEVRVGLVLKAFAGLRTSELLRLDWKEIRETQLIVVGTKAKTRQRRVVTLSENLRTWLAPHRQAAGKVIPTSARSWHDSVRRFVHIAGIELPKNALRHSFCSYHLAKHKNENLTAAEAGNTPAMIYRHYRALVTEKEATEYWLIQPPAEGNIVTFESAA